MEDRTPIQESYMRRCLQLAALGAGHTAPNPMVGAVLVRDGRIIGEGYHRRNGEAHAEVNCVNSVAEADRPLIPQSTLYVSLEPCVHQGKTPPCTGLIIREAIPKVVVGCLDPFAAVSGKGVEKLKSHHIAVEVGILGEECGEMNRRFFTFHEQQRPYVILKWAQTKDGFIAGEGGLPVRISNPCTDRLVHRWRGEEAGILVGCATALSDNPRLTNRLWSGNQPLRMVLDRELSLPERLYLLDGTAPTLVFNARRELKQGLTEYIRLDYERETIPQIMRVLYDRQVLSLVVEGGARLLQSFIDGNHWDEARIITGDKLLFKGLKAPGLNLATQTGQSSLAGDEILFYKPLRSLSV